MKYFFVVGEASGDLHASKIVHEIKIMDNDAEISAWGGDQMREAGASILKHIRDLSFMGFQEVLVNLPTIFRNFDLIKAQILHFRPDVLVLVDYPGFNLRLLPWAKKQGFKISYYIAPQAWAWKAGRVKNMAKYIDDLMVILPFEKKFFNDLGMTQVSYVGHPLRDAINGFVKDPNFHDSINIPRDRPILALLPGSRKQEISRNLPLMIQIAADFTMTPVVACAPSIDLSYYHTLLTSDQISTTKLVANRTYDILSVAQFALVASGTATLETALFKVPQIVCFKGSFLSVFIARNLVTVKYISLVNLILDEPVIKEMIQDDFSVRNVTIELQKLLESSEFITQCYDRLDKVLGLPGASTLVAQRILSLAQKK